jgi:lysozyme
VDKSNLTLVENMLILNEGVSNQLYRCTANKPTIGVGHNLEDNKLSDRAILTILDDDIQAVSKELHHRLSWLQSADPKVYIVLVDMGFNLGVPRLMKFKRMLKYLENKDYFKASQELKYKAPSSNNQELTNYYKQTKSRAIRNYQILIGEKTPNQLYNQG